MFLCMSDGIELSVSAYLCKHETVYKWKRTNRNNRIAKKWRKKYGAKFSYTKCRGVVVETSNKFVMCPHAYQTVKTSLEKANQ